MSYRVYSSPTATIANGQTTSSEVDTNGLHLVGLQFPAAFTGNSVTIQRAKDPGGTFGDVRDLQNSGAYPIPVTAGAYVPLDPVVMLGVQHFRIVADQAQGGSRAIECVCVPVVR